MKQLFKKYIYHGCTIRNYQFLGINIRLRSGEREVTGSIPGRDIPKSLKMVLAAPRLALRFTG